MRRTVVLGVILLVVGLCVGAWFALELTRQLRPNTRGPTTSEQSDEASNSGDETVRSVPGRSANGGEEPTPDVPAGDRSVRGTVSDTEEHPLADVEVSLFVADPSGREIHELPAVDLAHPAMSARTSADGSFEMKGAPSGRLVVVARKEGFASDSDVIDEDTPAELVLSPGVLRRFEVVDARDAPVAGASIALRGDKSIRATATTDERGGAQLRVEGDSFAIVRAAGHATVDLAIDGEDGVAQPIRIELREGLPIAGVAVDGEGKPLAGVLVHLRNSQRIVETAPRTDSDGAFRFDGLDAQEEMSRWELQAKAEGRVGENTPVVPGDLGSRVVLYRPGSIRGIVVHGDGSPAIGAKAWPYGRDTVDGKFWIDELEPGRIELWARVRSPVDPCMELSGQAFVDLAEGADVTEVRIVVGPPLDQSFVLVRALDGEKTAPAHILVWDQGVDVGDSWLCGDEAKRDGAVLIQVRKPPGTRVDLGAWIGPHLWPTTLNARTDKPVDTEAGPPFTLVDMHLGAPGRLRLKLVDPASREIPYASSHVWCEPAPADGLCTTNAIEQFRAELHVPGYAARTIRFDPPHPALREETVRLEPAHRVTGRVFAADGHAPQPGLEAHIHMDAARAGEEDAVALDEDGRFEFSELPTGSAELRIVSDQKVRLLREFEIGAEPSIDLGDLRLVAPSLWRGLVVDSRGHGVGGATVEFLDARDSTLGDPSATRPDGTFEATLTMPPRLRIHRTGLATRIVDVAPDAPQPVRIVLQPAGSIRVRVLKWADAGWGDLEVRLPGTKHSWDPHFADGSLIEGNVYDDLPPGPVDVVLVTRSGDLMKRVEIVAGQVVDVVFGE